MTEKAVDMKKLLFGNQKQANVINDSVAQIVSDYFEKHKDTSLDNEPIEEQMYMLVRHVTEKGVDNADDALFIRLVCGEQSYQVLESGVPYVVTSDQPSVESPKHNFRINALGVEAPVEEEPKHTIENIGKPAVGPDEVYSEEDNYLTRATKIKDAILPMCPTPVREELADNEWAQALCMAEYYYGHCVN